MLDVYSLTPADPADLADGPACRPLCAKPVVRRRLGERDNSGPLLPFLVGPCTGGLRQHQSFADGVNKLRKLSNYSTVLPQLRMNEPARWTTLLRLAEVCSRWWLSIRAGAEHQAWRQRLAIQARAVYAPDWRERFDRCGADGRDAGALQLTGDLVAQRLGDIQVSVVHDARRPEEEIAAL